MTENQGRSSSIVNSEANQYRNSVVYQEAYAPSSLSHVTGVVSMRDIPSALESEANLTNLLQHLIQIATTSCTPELLLARVAKAIGIAFQVDGCAIVCSTVLPDQLQATHWCASSDTAQRGLFSRDCRGLMQRLVCPQTLVFENFKSSDGTPEHGENASLWQHLMMPVPLSVGSSLEMPTQFQGTTNGIISLMRLEPVTWDPSQLEKLELVAQQIAAIIAQLRLQQQVARQLQYQSVVNQLTMTIRNSSDVGEILSLATTKTAQALCAQRGLLLRLKYWDPLFREHALQEVPKARVTVTCEWVDPESALQRPSLMSDPAEPSPLTLNQSFWLAECELCQQVFKNSRPFAIDDQKYLPGDELLNQVHAIFGLENLQSLLITPLESQGMVLGFLIFQSLQPRSWQQSEIELAELVSAQISNAMIQTETLRQVQWLVEKRTAELQQSLTVQAKLYERTRQQVDQLRKLNQLKDEFLDTVSHELRTPLTSMALSIRMLRQVGLASDRSARYLDILEQQCAQETGLVNDLLALRELEANQVSIQLEPIPLVDLFQSMAASFNQRWATKGLTLDLDLPAELPTLESDRDSLYRILSELLTNAGKYSSPNSCVQLKLLYRQNPPTNQVIVALSNKGAGISSEELPYIFDKFRRCQGATQNAIQGTGLGLALVKSLVQHLNGTISASSMPTDNAQVWETCFTLILPQSLEPSKV